MKHDPILQIVITRAPDFRYRVILMSEHRTEDRFLGLDSIQALDKIDNYIHALVPYKSGSVLDK